MVLSHERLTFTLTRLIISHRKGDYLWCLTLTSGESKGRGREARAPRGLNSFKFMHFFRKIWQNVMLAPSEGWRPTPAPPRFWSQNLREILDPPILAVWTKVYKNSLIYLKCSPGIYFPNLAVM